MTRQDVVKMMARAMHEWGYTSPYESLSEASRLNREAEAEAALEALENENLLVVELY